MSERVTKVSWGMERILAVWFPGSMWRILMVSLRWPGTWEVFPKALAAAPVSPARLSEPTMRTL
jgi:hypothetical protein